MTQMQLAQKSGVKQATISDIERGRIKSPSIDTAYRIATALGVELHDVFPIPQVKAKTA